MFDSIKGLFGGSAEKATEAATKAAASREQRGREGEGVDRRPAPRRRSRRGRAPRPSPRPRVAGQAKEAVTGVADAHGDKVTGAASAGHAYVSDKTGGKLDPVTGKVEELTGKAVGALQSDTPVEAAAAEGPGGRGLPRSATPPRQVADMVAEGGRVLDGDA